MREILYRAISLCRGEGWVYGQPRHYARNPHTEKWTIYDPATGIETDIAEETLGQYTGLTDKNGTKIFEGDYVFILEPDNLECVGYGRVVFLENYGLWYVEEAGSGISSITDDGLFDIYDNDYLYEIDKQKGGKE